MDCEKFESLLIDELYGELDEVTSAAVRRHAAGCARCGALLSGLRATRKVAALPMEEPSADLEDRILSAVREQQKVLPLRARASSVLSRAGAWAMRPQTAMAAVFLLVIGTSFVLVQSRKQVSMAGANAEGMPMQAAAASPTATAMASAYVLDQKETAFAHGVEEKRLEAPKALPSTVTPDPAFADGERERNDKAKDELAKNETVATGGAIANAAPIAGLDMTATRSSANLAGGGQGQTQPGGGGGGGTSGYGNGPVQQQAQAHASAPSRVQALRAQGCNASIATQYDQLRTPEATLEAGRCYRSLGQSDAARQRFSSLQSTPYAAVAQQELDQMTPAAARKAPAEAQVQATQPRATTTTPAQQQKPAAIDAQKAGGY